MTEVFTTLRGDERQVRMERALLDSQARLMGIIASAMDAIISIDAAQRVILFNQAAELMFGCPAESMIGKPLDFLVPERFRGRHQAHIRRFGETGVTSRSMGKLGTLYGLRRSGEEFPIEASISQIEVANGKIYTVILRDITERVKAEEKLIEDIAQRKAAEAALQAKTDEIQTMSQQLWQAARLATMGELAASVAHELNNPLAILSLRIESILARQPDSSPDRRELEVMEQEVDRMASLVANLLQFSRSGKRQVSSMDLCEEIERTLELIRSYLVHRRINVRWECGMAVPMIQADRQQMRQLFLNLFTNASDAMPGGGDLTIRVQPVDGSRAVSVDVDDTGVGIKPEDLAHVIEPFYTTKKEGKGTGLGLSICRRIVEEHAGVFEISSPGVNQGARAHILLPTGSGTKPGFLEEESSLS